MDEQVHHVSRRRGFLRYLTETVSLMLLVAHLSSGSCSVSARYGNWDSVLLPGAVYTWYQSYDYVPSLKVRRQLTRMRILDHKFEVIRGYECLLVVTPLWPFLAAFGVPTFLVYGYDRLRRDDRRVGLADRRLLRIRRPTPVRGFVYGAVLGLLLIAMVENRRLAMPLRSSSALLSLPSIILAELIASGRSRQSFATGLNMLGYGLVGLGTVRGLKSQGPKPGFCDCGYDLTGNVSGTCPECGKAVA